jgi:hypothetical protein
MDNSIKNTGDALYPSLNNASSSTNTGDLSSGASVTSSETHIPTQTSLNSGNSLGDINTLLQARKTNVTHTQEFYTRIRETNIVALVGLSVAIVALLLWSAMISPFIAIGLAATVIVAVTLLATNHYLKVNHGNCGMQNMCLDMLLEGLKGKTPTAISLEDSTELLNILNKAVSSANNQKLKVIDNIRRYNKFKDTKYQEDPQIQEALITEIQEFASIVFKNTELTAYLEKLGFDVKDVQDSIDTYVTNSEINSLSKTILGNQYIPSKVEG